MPEQVFRNVLFGQYILQYWKSLIKLVTQGKYISQWHPNNYQRDDLHTCTQFITSVNTQQPPSTGILNGYVHTNIL